MVGRAVNHLTQDRSSDKTAHQVLRPAMRSTMVSVPVMTVSVVMPVAVTVRRRRIVTVAMPGMGVAGGKQQQTSGDEDDRRPH